MPSVYLDSSEYDAFGLTSTVTEAQVMRASSLIDAYLKRPLGLAYLMDQEGVPCAMQGGSPRMTYTLGALSPGSNVTVAITPANATQDLIGEVLIVEVDSVNIEALVVTAVPAANQLTFKTVKYSHAGGTKASLGFVITEEKSLPGMRSVVRSMQHPFVTMLSCLGRYGYGRRSDQAAGTWGDVNLLAMVQAVGGPPAWSPIEVANCGFSALTGEVWIPAGGLMAYFSDVRMHYIAGFPASDIPIAIKAATATLANVIVKTTTSSGETSIGGNTLAADVKSYRAGDTEIVRFGNVTASTSTEVVTSSLDRDTLNLIAPFRASMFV